ncbi:MAG: YigZ family protein [Erysipelotrichaceae bacterium]
MKHIKDTVITSQTINKSEFITHLVPIDNEVQAKEYLLKLKKEHSFANHICYALICNNQQTTRSSDDKEPARTAGIPILNVLIKNDLDNCLCAIIRYFGGIKLGSGGLIRAYSSSAAQAINEATITIPTIAKENIIQVPYDLYDKINYLLTINDIKIIDTQFDLNILITYISFNDELIEKINQLSSGKIKYLSQKEITIEI